MRLVPGLGADWAALTACHVYTIHDFHASLERHFASTGLTRIGWTWQLCRPPIVELEFEMDVRAVAVEHVLAA